MLTPEFNHGRVAVSSKATDRPLLGPPRVVGRIGAELYGRRDQVCREILSRSRHQKLRKIMRADLEAGRVQMARGSVAAVPFPDRTFRSNGTGNWNSGRRGWRVTD